MSSIKDLQQLGGFVSDKPIKKTITFKLDDDEELSAEIWVRKLSIGDYEQLYIADADNRSRTAKAITVGIRLGAEGKEVLSFEQAFKLHPRLAGAMLEAFNEVNTPKKSSRPKNDSSAT